MDSTRNKTRQHPKKKEIPKKKAVVSKKKEIPKKKAVASKKKEIPKKKAVVSKKKEIPKKKAVEPKNVFSCKLSNGKIWLNIFKSLKSFTNIATMNVDHTGIFLFGNNSSNTGMYELKIPRKFFSSYTCDKPTDYNIILDDFCNILRFLDETTSLLIYSKVHKGDTSGNHEIIFDATTKDNSKTTRRLFISFADSYELEQINEKSIQAAVTMNSSEFKTICTNIRYDNESTPTHTDFSQKKPKSAPKIKKGFTELHMLMKKDRLELSAKLLIYKFKITYLSEEPQYYRHPLDGTKKNTIISYDIFKEQCEGIYSMNHLYKISKSSILSKQTTFSIFDNGLLSIMFKIEGEEPVPTPNDNKKKEENNENASSSYAFLKYYVAPIGDDEDEDTFSDIDDELMYESESDDNNTN